VSPTEILAVFRAQTENVRELQRARKQIQRAINFSLRRGDSASARVQVRLLALLYVAWSEASFLKLVHTPYGFRSSEIVEIKRKHREHSLEDGWLKCVDLAVQRIEQGARSGELANRRRTLKGIIRHYVGLPAMVRNKLAHGQWLVALNFHTTAVNSDVTTQIASLSSVSLHIQFEIHTYLSRIVEDMIESPAKAFQRDYWVHLSELEEFIATSQHWTDESKTQELQRKPLSRQDNGIIKGTSC
jgi:hypothetical protein